MKLIKKILIPLPMYGFDPTEVAIPWKLLSKNNHQVVFTTPKGTIGEADKIMVTGEGLSIVKGVLMARADAVKAYHEMIQSEAFLNPIKYEDVKESDFDSIYLPGGHDKGVKEYLESKKLQSVIPEFFISKKPVAAVCHGVVLVARSKEKSTNESILKDYKTTALLKSQEKLAYNMTRVWMGDYYLTYPDTTVEDEVKELQNNKEGFVKGPKPLFRDSSKNMKFGFAHVDRNYVSARWPGDIYNMMASYLELLK